MACPEYRAFDNLKICCCCAEPRRAEMMPDLSQQQARHLSSVAIGDLIDIVTVNCVRVLSTDIKPFINQGFTIGIDAME